MKSKKSLTILISAMLFILCLGSLALAENDKEKFNLRPAMEITNQTRFSFEAYQTNSRLREICYEEEDKNKNLKRVFYGITTNGQLGLSVVVYRDVAKEVGEEDSHLVFAHFTDAHYDIMPEEFVEFIAYDPPEISCESDDFFKSLKIILDLDRRESEASRWFLTRLTGDTLYVGERYKNQETGEFKDLVYVVKFKKDKDGYSYSGWANGDEILQDTDGDILWH